jgi:hypothetical protein
VATAVVGGVALGFAGLTVLAGTALVAGAVLKLMPRFLLQTNPAKFKALALEQLAENHVHQTNYGTLVSADEPYTTGVVCVLIVFLVFLCVFVASSDSWTS